MNTYLAISMCIVAAQLLTSCDNSELLRPTSLPDRINIIENSLYPEGIAFDEEKNVFYVSSVAKGKISKISIDGTVTTFANSPDLVSTLGIELDKANNRLLVCVTDPGFNEVRSSPATIGQLAGIAIYDIFSGIRLDFIQLATGAPHLANDVTLDDAGNIYVTDSFSPTVHRVDINGNSSALISNDAFMPQPMNFGLNGITYHSDGFLIVSKYDEGKLFKIPLINPENFTEVLITNGTVPAIDGVLLTDKNTLAIASNNLGSAPHNNAVYQLTTIDNWETATIESTVETGSSSFPTTFTKAGNELYVQYARLNALVNSNTPAAEDFPIVKIDF